MAPPKITGKIAVAKNGLPVGAKIKQPHGGALLNGGSNPGAGRPPDEFRKWCREVLGGKPTVAAVQTIADNPDHPAFLGAMKWLASYGYGQPTEHHEITGKDGQPVQFVIVGGKKV